MIFSNQRSQFLTLASEGMWNVGRRELRFLLEASVKLAFIEQEQSKQLIVEKLLTHSDLLRASSISCKNKISLGLLPKTQCDQFSDEVGRLYGVASEYVHLTGRQIEARIRSVEAGFTPGFENENEAREASELVSQTFAVALVYLFHAAPAFVAGDFFVDSDGNSPDWLFSQSKYVAAIDSQFDYKHERQHRLDALIAKRAERINF
ncbi:hypothetical protein LP414_28660 [Polaromonas sp. P1(28)-13]|nr:hypothetical protein LP414_28660 [Polaromonas sp. P1(28)-13]